MELTKLDLRVLKDEALIYFRWYETDRGTGRLSSHAFEAVKNNFRSRGTVAAAAAGEIAVIADQNAIALRFQRVSTELVNLARELIDADEALSAEHEALSIAAELIKPRFDETIITRKTKGFASRLSLTTWPRRVRRSASSARSWPPGWWPCRFGRNGTPSTTCRRTHAPKPCPLVRTSYFELLQLKRNFTLIALPCCGILPDGCSVHVAVPFFAALLESPNGAAPAQSWR